MRVAPRMIAAACAVALAAFGTGCKENRPWQTQDMPGTGVVRLAIDSGGGVQPGIHPHVVYGVLRNPFAGNGAAPVEGRRLFVSYNCSGCHGGRAGGGMGPSLRDSVWRYGSSDTQIFATITEGRPGGMPAWGAKIPQGQIWELVSYIRTLGSSREPDRLATRITQ